MVTVQESTMDDIPLQDEMGTEFRLLMAYAQRSRSASRLQHIQNRQEAAAVEGVSEMEETIAGKDHKGHKPSKTRTKKSRWPKLLTPMCLRPGNDKKKKKSLKEPEDLGPEQSIVRKLKKLVKKHSEFEESNRDFRGLARAQSLETDSHDDELIKNIVNILQKCADRLYEEMESKDSISMRFRSALSYEFFSSLLNTFLTQTVPCSAQETETQKTKVALCFDVTTKLTALDNQPMNRVLGFGAKYIKENYTPWIQSNGGWEKALNTEVDEEEIE